MHLNLNQSRLFSTNSLVRQADDGGHYRDGDDDDSHHRNEDDSVKGRDRRDDDDQLEEIEEHDIEAEVEGDEAEVYEDREIDGEAGVGDDVERKNEEEKENEVREYEEDDIFDEEFEDEDHDEYHDVIDELEDENVEQVERKASSAPSSNDDGSQSKKEDPSSMIVVPGDKNQSAGAGLQDLQNLPTPPMVPMIPLHQKPAFPRTMTPMLLEDLSFIQNIVKTSRTQNLFVGLFLVRKKFRGQKSITDVSQIHSVGVLAQIRGIYPTKHGGGTVYLASIRRIRIKDTFSDDHTLLKVEDFKTEEYNKNSQVIKAYNMEIVATMRELVKLNFFWKEAIQTYLDHRDIGNPEELADMATMLTSADPDDMQSVLEMSNVTDRMIKSLTLLKAELDMVKIQAKINKQLEEKISNSQRRFYLQEQLKQIKKELGLEKDEKEALINKFRDRIAEKKIPEDVYKVIDEEITKLSMLEPSSAEFNLSRNYLDWLTVLPWQTYTEDNLDIKHADEVLNEDHYGLKDVKERILEFIAVGNLRGDVQGKIICMVGPPGVGKTSIGKSIARALGREFFRFSVGGLTDVAEIKGHRRTYIGAMPGKLIQCLKLSKSSNPVIMIDEIDKMGKGHTGDPASALLEVLDPEQNSSFLDHYLDVRVDLSHVLFVCTANVLETIPKPLLDRMEVIRLSGYVLEEKEQIARRYLIPAARRESGLTTSQVALRDGAVRELIRSYCRESGVRNLQKHIEKVFRKVALEFARGRMSLLSVTFKNLKDYVGQPVFTSDRFYPRTPVGVTMGLAWTSMGGSTLYIETTSDGTSPGLKTTGQMGEVMHESTDIAYTYAKKYLTETQSNNRFFDQHHIHMHIPEGATPKDGPSAGVTMVTSLMSLALDQPVRHNLAMTGEITLTGKVLVIGGVKEKTIAARRSGIKYIIFPKANKRDWDELDDFIRAGLTPFFVDYYHEVYQIAFGDLEAASKKQEEMFGKKVEDKKKSKRGRPKKSKPDEKKTPKKEQKRKSTHDQAKEQNVEGKD